MTNLRWICLIIALIAFASSGATWARGGYSHRHSHLNLGISVGGYYSNPGFYGSGFYGSGFYGPSFYGYRSYGYPGPFFNAPLYSYPPTVVVPVTPPIYIQQEQPKPVQPQANYWHYCQNPEGYYPYVKTCPGGWLQVAPEPPAQ